MHASLFDMLHDRADHHVLAITDGIDVDFDGAVEEVIQQHRAVIRHLHGITQVTLEFVFLIDDLHGATTEHVRGTDNQRVTDLGRCTDGFVFAAHRGIRWLTQIQALDHVLETLAVFGAVDGLGAGTNNRYASFFQGASQFQRRLPTVLHDHALGLLDADDFQHIFQSHRLEIQAVGGIVVSGDGFRVAVDHDGLVTVFTHGQRRVYAAVVELDTLTNTVRATAQHHDLVTAAWIGFALFFIGRVHVRGIGGKLGGAGIHPLVHRVHLELVTQAAQGLFADAQQAGQTDIGKALALQAVHQVVVDIGQAESLDPFLFLDQILELNQEPGIDLGQIEDLLQAHAGAEGVGQIPDTVRTGHGQFTGQIGGGIGAGQIHLGIQTTDAHFQTTQGFLQGFLEGPTNGHDFAHGFHLGRQARIGVGEFLEGKTRDLGYDVVNCRLKGRRRATASDVVLQLIQGVTHGQLGGDLGNRETGGLGGQRRGTRDPRVHFDHHHAAVNRVDAELYVRTTGFHADLTQYRQRGVTHDLVFLVGQRLGWCDSDRVTCVHAHRIEVFDRADDDAVVLFVADHFHLVFFPADQRFVDQQLLGRRQVQTAVTDFFELFTVVRNAATGAAHGEGRTNDARETDLIEDLVGFLHVVGDTRDRAGQTDGLHGLVKARTVFGLVDGVGVGTDHFDIVLFQYAMFFQVQRTVQCGLAAHGRQHGIRTLLLDDLGDCLPFDRFDIGGVGHGRVGHDGRRVGIDQDDAEAFFLQRLAGLGSGIVKFAGLADHDRTGAEDQNAFDVCTFWHSRLQILGGSAALGHGIDETIKQGCHIVRAGTGLRVTLEAEGGFVRAFNTLQRAVEQRLVGGSQGRRQTGFIHGKTVVLAGDHHYAAIQILNRVVGAVVAVTHFQGLGTGCQRQQLMTQTDAEDRDIGFQDVLDRLNGIVAGLRVTRAVGQEHAVRIQRQHLGGAGLRRYHSEAATACHEHAQDVVLDPIVVSHDMVGQIGIG